MSEVFSWMAAQIAHMTPPQIERKHPANPFPKGMERGSATWRAYVALLAVYPATLTCNDLRRSCHAGRGAVAWALRYLAERGAIQKYPHPRHAAYYLYRAVLEP